MGARRPGALPAGDRVNTNMHVNRRQATGLLKCVRYSKMLRDAYEHVEATHSLPTEEELHGLETMLLAALERIRDKEAAR